MDNNILKFEKHPVLSEEGFLKYKNAIRAETWSWAISVLGRSAELDAAKESMKKIRDEYALFGVRDESTDHQL